MKFTHLKICTLAVYVTNNRYYVQYRCYASTYHYRHLVLLECALEKLDDCVVPGQLTEQNSYRCICANDVTFLAEKFQCATSTAAKNDLHGLDKNCKTLKLLLQFLNTLSMQSDQLKILQEMPQLLENAIGKLTRVMKI